MMGMTPLFVSPLKGEDGPAHAPKIPDSKSKKCRQFQRISFYQGKSSDDTDDGTDEWQSCIIPGYPESICPPNSFFKKILKDSPTVE
jgi:hypothetical protein